VPPSGIREVMARAAELKAAGRDVINWHIGRPDFDTPEHIKRACASALDRGAVHYAPTAGLPALREALASRHALERGLAGTRAEQVVVTNGAMEAVTCSMLALLDPGDEVIVPEPCWANVKWAAVLAGGVPVTVDTELSDGFQLCPSGVRAAVTPRTKLLVIPSPGNPTGAVLGHDRLAELAAVAEEHDLLVLADDTYNRLFYGPGRAPVAPSFASVPRMAERTVTIGTLSKTFAMDGWRLGWAIAPDGGEGTAPLAQAIARMRYYVSACSPTFTMHAAVEALLADQGCVEEMRTEYDARRRVIVEGLRRIPGVRVHEPEGAFYVFPHVADAAPGVAPSSIARRLLEEHGIAAVDGEEFGAAGAGHLRIAYSCSLDECTRGVERLAAAFASMR